jgi:hypothetical protein
VDEIIGSVDSRERSVERRTIHYIAPDDFRPGAETRCQMLGLARKAAQRDPGSLERLPQSAAHIAGRTGQQNTRLFFHLEVPTDLSGPLGFCVQRGQGPVQVIEIFIFRSCKG